MPLSIGPCKWHSTHNPRYYATLATMPLSIGPYKWHSTHNPRYYATLATMPLLCEICRMPTFTLDDILAARERIHDSIHRTPVITSSYINRLCDKSVFFKCEHLQKTGSFKARGATNAVMLTIKNKGKNLSMITHSSGNHGQALAYAAGQFGIPCTVVVPNNAPTTKVDAMRAYGATLVDCEPSQRESTVHKLQKEAEYELVDPHDDYRVMAGQGTVALELLDQVPGLDAVLIPVGGGGLVSGMAVAIASINPSIRIFCVEPEGKHLQSSIDAGRTLWKESDGPVDTVADGIRVLKVGSRCFPEVQRCCQPNVLTVNDEEIINALELLYSRLKQAVEPTAAVTLAALLKYDALLADCKKVGLILCGGNVDLQSLPFLRK